jgi:phosphate starvation-inducible membrane PsiE
MNITFRGGHEFVGLLIPRKQQKLTSSKTAIFTVFHGEVCGMFVFYLIRIEERQRYKISCGVCDVIRLVLVDHAFIILC